MAKYQSSQAAKKLVQEALNTFQQLGTERELQQAREVLLQLAE